MLLYDLSNKEQEQLVELYSSIIGYNPTTDEEVVNICKNNLLKLFNKNTPPLSIYLKNQFKHNTHNYVVILTNLPKVNQSNILTILLGFLLGEVIKEYEGGVWLKTIKADYNLDTILDSPSSKDRKEFSLHTDLSYTEQPPHYFLFHCLSNPKTLGGMSTICSLEDLLSKMSTKTKKELHQVQFRFSAPSYYINSGYITHPILNTDKKYTKIRFRQDGMKILTKNGVYAVAELIDLLANNMKVIRFEENTAMFIDNNRCLHGRYSFLLPKEEDKTRHFNQVYISV